MGRKPPLKPGERASLPPATLYEPKWGRSLPSSAAAAAATAASAKAALTENPGLASERLRERMVERLREQGIADDAVLSAMLTVPRHRFVDEALASRAYEDTALPIGHQQTISQPYVVARSIALGRAHRQPEQPIHRVLEVGSGCGYQAAVLALLFPEVISVERIGPLHEEARANLRPENLLGLSLPNCELRLADGLLGCPDDLPFDLIVLAAGMAEAPQDLLRQLSDGGVLVAPLGSPHQQLVVMVRLPPSSASGASEPQFVTHRFDIVQFVPILRGVQT